MAIVSTTAILEEVRTGKLLAIAVPTPQRLPEMPDVPAINEVVADFGGLKTWNGFFVPAGTPRPVIDQIFQATRTTMADPAFRDLLVRSGFEPQPDSSPDTARRIVDEEIARWTPVIKALGLKLD